MKITPPNLFFISVAIIIISKFFFVSYITFLINFFGLFILIFGVCLSWAGSAKFNKEGANVNTFEKPSRLITEGLYKYSRNPMYLGLIATLAGLSLLIGTVVAFLVTIAFILVVDFYYIPFEEQAMLKTFGDKYLAYKEKTRRWL